MKFEIGDKVTVLHSNEEGEVVEMINDKMVMVEVRGVRFPAYVDQLDFPYFQRFTQKKPLLEKKPKTFADQLPRDKTPKKTGPMDGCWLRILPVSDEDEFGDEIVESLKIYLVNNTDRGMHFQYSFVSDGKNDFNLTNEVLPSKDFYLHDIPFDALNDSPTLSFDFTLLQSDKKKARHFEYSNKLRAKQVFTRIEEIQKKGDASFAYKIFDTYPDKLPEDDVPESKFHSKTGNKIYDAKHTRQHLEQPKYEVDLHIEKLLPEWQQLNNFEMLTIQLAEFEKYLDLAIAHHQRNLIVIHGVGKGKLKDEIHQILNARREVRSYINQYDPRYGYGATEIFL